MAPAAVLGDLAVRRLPRPPDKQSQVVQRRPAEPDDLQPSLKGATDYTRTCFGGVANPTSFRPGKEADQGKSACYGDQLKNYQPARHTGVAQSPHGGKHKEHG